MDVQPNKTCVKKIVLNPTQAQGCNPSARIRKKGEKGPERLVYLKHNFEVTVLLVQRDIHHSTSFEGTEEEYRSSQYLRGAFLHLDEEIYFYPWKSRKSSYISLKACFHNLWVMDRIVAFGIVKSDPGGLHIFIY